MSGDWTPIAERPDTDGWTVTSETPIAQRGLGERFVQNAVDAIERNPTVAEFRQAYSNPLGFMKPATPSNLNLPMPGVMSMPGFGAGLRAALGVKGLVDRAMGHEDPMLSAATEKARRETFESQSAADPFYTAPGGVPGKTVAGAATLGGQVLGSFTDPTNLVGGEGKTLLSRVLQNVGINAAGDVRTQASDTQSGIQDEWKPLQTVSAAAFGALIGGAHEGVRAVGEVGKALHAAIPDYEPPAPTTWTVDNLWPRLAHKEHGVDAEGHSLTSPKGARGPAQLMPETAREVAQGLGQPQLAEIALGDGSSANVANEMLGRTYLGQMLHQFDGDPVLGLAAYNAGPGKVHEWVRTYGDPNAVGPARWLSMIPYKETRDYVHTILGSAAGEPHTLTPDDHAYMRGRMEQFPQEPEVALPPLATTAADEAAQAHADIGPFPETLQPTGEVSSGIPWDDTEIPGEKTAFPSPKEIPEGQDFTDQALDQLRSGKKLRTGEGPSLIEALVKAGGLKDSGGELADILGGNGGDRLQKMLRRVRSGMDLDQAAEWAQERGYIGRTTDAYAEAAGPNELLEAIRREVAGEKVYPADRINEHARALQEHMTDLDEIVNHLGIDLEKHTNPEVRRLMDEWMNGPEHEAEGAVLGMKDTGEVLGMTPKGAMATGAEAVQRVREAHQRAELRNEIMASTRAGPLTGSRAPVAVPAPRDAAGAIDTAAIPKVQGVPEIIRTLADALGYPVRQGRISLRDALGTYSRRSGMTRSKGRYDLNVLAHEFGHALEFTDGHELPNVLAAMKAHADDLKAMDYNQSQVVSRGPNAGKPPPGRRHEGFAEWFRWYITNPDHADAMPGGAAFRQDFEAAMAKDDPKGLAAIQAAQRSYQAFLEAPSLAATREHVVAPDERNPIQKIISTVADEGPFKASADIANEARRLMVDQLEPWERVVREALDIAEEHTGERPKLKATEDPYKLMSLMPNVASRGQADLFGVRGYHDTAVTSPSLVEALNEMLGHSFLPWKKSLIRDAGTYLIGRRVVHLYDAAERGEWTDELGNSRGRSEPPDSLSRAAWAQTVRDLEEAHPHWPAAAEKIYGWNNALWKKGFDGGFIKEPAYLAALEDNPDYVPGFRDISDKEFGGQQGGPMGKSTKAQYVVRLKGSDRAYINPIYSMMKMSFELNYRLAINDALKALDDIGQTFGPDIGRLVERLKAHELVGTNTSVEEVLQNAARRFGVDNRDAAMVMDSIREAFGAGDDDALSTSVWRATATTEKGEPVVWVWRGGERIPLRLPDGDWGRHMVAAIGGMEKGQRSLLLDMLSIPAVAARAGITAHLAYFLTNSFRDQMEATALTEVGYRPFIDNLRGIAAQAKGHLPGQAPAESHLLYNALGGEMGGNLSAAANLRRAETKLQNLRQGGKTIREFASWNGFSRAMEFAETGTREGIFMRGKAMKEAEGHTPYEAAMHGVYEAYNYMPFSRRGASPTMHILARIAPFFNAGIQASDRTYAVGKNISKLPAIIGPLFGRRPATPAEYEAFAHAAKMWAIAGVLAIGGLSLRALYKNNKWYQEVSNEVRGTHWVVMTHDSHYAVIPKPQALGFLSDIMERAFESAAEHDPAAWKHLMADFENIFVPAHDIKFIQPVFDVMQNKDSFDSPIVPDYLKARLPRDQYTDHTSDLAKWIGAHWPGEGGLSPADLDYIAKQWGGTNARNALDADHARAPTGFDPADAYAMSRFMKDATRGANSTSEFHSLASSGQWGQAAASVGGLINDGKFADASQRLRAMDPPERGYVMATLFGQGERHDETARHASERHTGEFTKQDHPMIRAEKAASVFGSMARELGDGNVRGPDLQPVAVTPDQRRDAIRVLKTIAVAEQRNSLIMAGVPDYANRAPIPTGPLLREFSNTVPQLVPALLQRWEEAKVQDIDTTAVNWAAARKMFDTPAPEGPLTQIMQAKRFPENRRGTPTQEAMKRAMSDVVPAAR